MKNITFEKAQTSDASQLAELRTQFILDFTGPQPEAQVVNLKNTLTSYFQKSITDNNSISYLAKVKNEIAGTGTLVFREQPGNFRNPTGRVGYVMNMYTLPKFRRQGICTSILELLLSEAGSAGITAFELHATKEGEPIYIKNGFIKHSEPTYRKYY